MGDSNATESLHITGEMSNHDLCVLFKPHLTTTTTDTEFQ